MSVPTIDFEEKVAEIIGVLKQKPQTAKEISQKISYFSTWRPYLSRIIDSRKKAGIPTKPLEMLIQEMSKQESELEKVYADIEPRERTDRLLRLVKPIYPFLSLDCNERLEAVINLPCRHQTKIDLLKINSENERDHNMWLNSLEQLLNGQLDSIGFGVSCDKCHKTSLSVRLFIDPQKIVDLARQGKIRVACRRLTEKS